MGFPATLTDDQIQNYGKSAGGGSFPATISDDHMSQIGSSPVQLPDSQGQAPAAAPTKSPLSFGDVARGTMNVINNNPVSNALESLAALPVQLGVKGVNAVTGTHIADPYANKASGLNITSSDQPLGQFAEKELGNAATVGSLFVPIGGTANVAKTALSGVIPATSKLAPFIPAASRVLANGAIGAMQGAGSAMQQGQGFGDVLKSGGWGGGIGAGLGAAGEIGNSLINKFANATPESRLTSFTKEGGAAKTLSKALDQYSTHGTNPIQTLSQNGLIKDLSVNGTKVNVEGLTNTAGTGSLDLLIDAQKDAGTQAVRGMPGTVPLENFKNTIIDAVRGNEYTQAEGSVGKTLSEIGRKFDDYAESYGDQITYPQLDKIRKAMNAKWNPETWDAEKAIGNAARSMLYDAAGTEGLGPALKSAMANEQELINAKSFTQKLAGHAVNGGQLKKWIADSVGAGIGMSAGGALGSTLGPAGTAIGGTVGAGVGGATTNYLVNRLNQGYFNPVGNKAATSLSRFITTPAVQGVKQIGKATLISGVAPSITKKASTQ